MKAISIRQPWAYFIMVGAKDVENRGWWTSYTGPLAIHCARAWKVSEVEKILDYVIDEGLISERPSIEVLAAQRGKIIAVARLVTVIKWSESPWAVPGEQHWILRGARRVDPPIPYVGRLGLWDANL